MNYNHCQFAGNLTTKPEIQKSSNHTPFCRVAIAINNYNSQSKSNEPMFINCLFFGTPAENLVKYQNKGDNIFVEGRLLVQKYFGTKGVTKISVTLAVSRMQFINSKNKVNSQNKPHRSNNNQEDYPDWIEDVEVGEV